MPGSCHGLCTWNLSQNAIKHLGYLMKDGSHFLSDFKKCMYAHDDEVRFEVAWCKLLSDYGVHENPWLTSVYAIKEKWAACYMKKAFTLGMRSTQLSESLNSDFKSCMKPDVDIIQFFKHFERIVEEKRYNELKCEYEHRHKLPRLMCSHSPMLKQVAQVYTLPIFDLFQKEFDLFLGACIKYRNEAQSLFEFVVTMDNCEGEQRVLFDPVQKSISCTCKRFETFGILCSHALKVFNAMEVKIVPNQYILKRWTRDARNGIIHDVRGKEVEGDPKLCSTRRYKQLCAKMVRLASEVSTSEEMHLLVDKCIDDLCKQIMDIRLGQRSVNEDGGVNNDGGDIATRVSESGI